MYINSQKEYLQDAQSTVFLKVSKLAEDNIACNLSKDDGGSAHLSFNQTPNPEHKPVSEPFCCPSSHLSSPLVFSLILS
ncbi:hypothetical protein GN956_G20768 [Arapaima gigas]